MTEKIKGELEIDRERGVVYFHATEEADLKRYGVVTILRICRIHPVRMRPGCPIDLTGSDRHHAEGAVT